MIWTSRYLFLHLPKTAGISVSNLLLSQSVERTFFTENSESMGGKDAVHVDGTRHEDLMDAESYFCHWNKSILDFEKIFVIMRNPYDQELSQYTYYRLGHDWDVGPAGRIALDGSFRNFLEKAPFKGEFPPRLDKFFTVLGRIPENLQIMKFETLNEDLRRYVLPYLAEFKLPHDNRSDHLSYEAVYDAELEELCYLRNRWFFDNGYYQRLRF